MNPKPIFVWHAYHEFLIFPMECPIETRIAQIRRNKPKHEIPIRLRLLKIVKGELPTQVISAGVRFAEVWCYRTDLFSPQDELLHRKVCVAYDNAIARNMPAILKLHAKECPGCPWDGKTIFPEANV